MLAFCQFTVTKEEQGEVKKSKTNTHTHTSMFDGVPDQFHQFISSRASLPLPLSFPPHGTTSPNSTFPSFDPYPSHQSLQSHLLHHPMQLHQPSAAHKDDEKDANNLLSINTELEKEGSLSEQVDPWSNDEVLALLRIRSSMENWFPDFTWEHVSRKLAELGFKRSAEKCKDKFEEESRYFNSINYNKNYRFFSELEELCHGDEENTQIVAEKSNQELEKGNEDEDRMGQIVQEDSRNETVTKNHQHVESGEVVKPSKGKKRKRNQKFEMLKGFCEDIVHKMMAQQEELHNKLLEDMMKRDEETIAREEAWKKQEMDRINKEIEMRAHEQAILADRQATIIEFLKKFTSGSQNQCLGGRSEEKLLKAINSANPPATSPPLVLGQNPNSNTCQPDSQSKLEAPTSSAMVQAHQDPSPCASQSNPIVPSSEGLAPHSPSYSLPSIIPKVPNPPSIALASQHPKPFSNQNTPLSPNSSSTPRVTQQNPLPNDKEDHGKRWPRDEVLALINLRCNLCSNGEDKEGAKAPLWERISQGMLELGYKRSAKRCKEKWENINKYFRKTKDVNKKRSLDSRTCPYFHQLSNLYNQGTLVAPSERQENRSSSLENQANPQETGPRTSQGVSSTDANLHVAEGEKNMLQVPAFDFEF